MRWQENGYVRRVSGRPWGDAAVGEPVPTGRRIESPRRGLSEACAVRPRRGPRGRDDAGRDYALEIGRRAAMTSSPGMTKSVSPVDETRPPMTATAIGP